MLCFRPGKFNDCIFWNRQITPYFLQSWILRRILGKLFLRHQVFRCKGSHLKPLLIVLLHSSVIDVVKQGASQSIVHRGTVKSSESILHGVFGRRMYLNVVLCFDGKSDIWRKKEEISKRKIFSRTKMSIRALYIAFVVLVSCVSLGKSSSSFPAFFCHLHAALCLARTIGGRGGT